MIRMPGRCSVLSATLAFELKITHEHLIHLVCYPLNKLRGEVRQAAGALRLTGYVAHLAMRSGVSIHVPLSERSYPHLELLAALGADDTHQDWIRAVDPLVQILQVEHIDHVQSLDHVGRDGRQSAELRHDATQEEHRQVSRILLYARVA